VGDLGKPSELQKGKPEENNNSPDNLWVLSNFNMAYLRELPHNYSKQLRAVRI
jgi:hypothetical protein